VSALDVLAELGGIGKPDGDPAALREAAGRLGGLADGYDRVITALIQVDTQARATWDGEAAEAFATTMLILVQHAHGTGRVLRAAADAIASYAGRLEAAQAAWSKARDRALAARATSLVPDPMLEAVDPDVTDARRAALAEADRADTDAREAARALAAELDALAEQAAPLPEGAAAPAYEDRRLGGWLIDQAVRARHDPLGAALEYPKQFAVGVGSTLRGYWDLTLTAAKAFSPGYALTNPAGWQDSAREVEGMFEGLTQLTTVNAVVNPAGWAAAWRQFGAGALNLDTLRTGNTSRWAGALAPDIALAAVGGTAAASARATATTARTTAAAARVAETEARLLKLIERVNPEGGDINCTLCVIATDSTLGGTPKTAHNVAEPIRAGWIEHVYGGKFAPVSGRAEIEAILRQGGPGARGIVWGLRNDKLGHVFNAVNDNGTIVFLDGQSGTLGSFDGFDQFRFLQTG
jgi:uncharacterized protein YukE